MNKYEEGIQIIDDCYTYLAERKVESENDREAIRNRVPYESGRDDTKYEDIMARKYDYIVIGAAKAWNNESMLDELLSAGRLGLLEAIRSWNQAKSSQVTYYNVCVKRAMINAMRKQDTYERYHDRLEDQSHKDEDDEPLSWEDVTEANTLNPEELIIRREEVEFARRVIDSVRAGLNERETDVLDNVLLGTSTSTSIATKHNTSETSIRRDKTRILELVRKQKEILDVEEV